MKNDDYCVQSLHIRCKKLQKCENEPNCINPARCEVRRNGNWKLNGSRKGRMVAATPFPNSPQALPESAALRHCCVNKTRRRRLACNT